MFHKVIHRVHASVSTEIQHEVQDEIECWCKPYVVSDPFLVEKEVVEQEMERQNMINLYVSSRACH